MVALTEVIVACHATSPGLGGWDAVCCCVTGLSCLAIARCAGSVRYPSHDYLAPFDAPNASNEVIIP